MRQLIQYNHRFITFMYDRFIYLYANFVVYSVEKLEFLHNREWDQVGLR